MCGLDGMGSRRRTLRTIAFLLVTAALAACKPAATENDAAANAATPVAAAPLSLARLDCGDIRIKDFDAFFSDKPGLYAKAPRDITDSCYLIRHGDQLMLWDTGFSDQLIGHPYVQPEQTASLKQSLIDQLKAGGIKPEQITIVGISHYHADHTGQASRFPGAELLIGKADYDALKQPSKDEFFKMAQGDLAHWLTGGGKAEAISGDKDVFGDGSVVMLAMPGHTPGHHSLLVNLASGPVLLSGDLYHAAEAREKRGVPPFNTSREQTLQSMDRFEAKAKQLRAKVIIQHEPADIGKLPAFPAAAK